MKNDVDESIAVGERTATERLGGRIKFQDGQITTYIVAEQGMPDVGRKYLFFLGYNRREAGSRSPREMNRHVLTAYELRGSKVCPLDGLHSMKAHEGKEVTTFLSEVREVVAGASRNEPK